MLWTKIGRVISIDINIMSNIIDQIGSSEFDETLLVSINQIAPVEEATGFLIDSKHDNHFGAGWCGKRADTANRVEKYVSQHFKNDPILKKLPENPQIKDTFYRVLHHHAITHSHYHWIFFDEPEFLSEIAVIQKTITGWSMIKFHLKLNQIPNDLCQQIAEFGAFLISTARRHTLYRDGSYNLEARPMTQEKLIARLEKRFPELTLRERQVCALTILGSSTQEIAKSLSITHSTVMTYRRRANNRLGISNANVLIREII